MSSATEPAPGRPAGTGVDDEPWSDFRRHLLEDGILLTTGSTSVNHIFGKLIGDIGVLIAFYYGATGLGCAWSYRKVAFKKLSFFFTGIFLPFIAGVFLFWVGVLVCISGGWQSGLKYAAPVLVTFGLGIPLVIIARFTSGGHGAAAWTM